MAKVLIVEDEVSARLTFKELLKLYHHIVTETRTVDEAMTALRTEHFDLILLDMELKPVSARAGFEVLNRKKKVPMNAATPVIIITGKVNPDLVKSKTDEQDNILSILNKPFSTNELLAAIDRVCRV